ncbi:HDOD domain-containing protein [Leptospira mayottensis]|uniref:HDOD domain protein n=2 Tax=Leptospira mayottensis TaxID=1137606 RepID=A0AA87SV50_9LEPT|nr:HDOD domain-containing protein [Leptospira mayottensis]AXR60623.1 HDOD domain-containing protein [Leptospira mayottensis]AXR64434.1 HDOD domain-containing protein [Leptospira mayottensis]AXR68155.1 HDOD domain-containing protein [Leptospira mayottensis]AZQ02946.1 HDOD domain-containing protein [Leptospira mayottensis 200901116]EKR98531.1 HDOD domain protein [Leptospira mayottensis 200901122]
MKIQWFHYEKEGYFLSVKNLNEPIESLNPLYLRITHFNRNIDKIIGFLLDRYLQYLDIIPLRECIFSILRETIMNAVKANQKRVIFKEAGWDIKDPVQYETGMEKFKEKLISKKDLYADLLEQNGLYVLVTFGFNQNSFLLKVANNVGLLPEENQRIQERISKARTYNNLSEVFENHGDESEGAGLGLAMSLLMLKNEGIEGDSYRIKSEEGITSAYIKIPFEFKKKNTNLQKTGEILSELDNLPTFPDNVNQIMSLINKPDSSIHNITELVGRDISLSANILKLANSASFSQRTKVENLEGAIKVIGLSELNSILLSLGTKKILEEKYKEFESIWERSSLSAFICRRLGERMGWKKQTITVLVCAALLHDVGRVILLSLEPDMSEKISEILGNRLLPSPLTLEEAALGISHTTLGGMICEKWNFSDTIRVAAEMHHRPLLVKKEFQDAVFSIYLSDMIIDISRGLSDYFLIQSAVLQHFGFKKEAELDEFMKRTLQEYKEFDKKS